MDAKFVRKVNDNCINCSACISVCPVNAIKFKKTNKNSFAAYIDENKCIHCGKCFTVCPLNKERSINNTISSFGAYSKDDLHVKNSSSGGVFGEIAKYFLGNKGIVYGASFNRNFEVEHIRINELCDLKKIMGSKYVQSKLGKSFTNIKIDLQNNEMVLFSGTPCQVAGLKLFLAKDYNNLFTIDLVCHGNPSGIVWKDYLNELQKESNSKIKNINFRSKVIEWKNPQMVIEFINGKKIQSSIFNNDYGRAFLKNMILNESCFSCSFNGFRNYSEITLGDYWGHKTKEKENEGLSLVIINNEKGKEMFEKIANKINCFPANIKEACLGNYPIIHSSIRHYNWDKTINGKQIVKKINYYLDEKNSMVKVKNNVAILNFHYENYNYGANLVAFSLSKVIQNMGYKPFIIDYDPFENIDSITRYRTFKLLEFRNRYLNLTPRFEKEDDLNILNNYFDSFVVGSDQVWRKEITGNNLSKYFFDFVDTRKNIISYGASFGNKNFEGNEHEIIYCKHLLKKFYNVSVREKDAIKECKKKFGILPTKVLDPTLLLSAEDYNNIFNIKREKENGVVLYLIFDILKKDFKKKIKSLFNDEKIINSKGEIKKTPLGNLFVYNSVNEWISKIKNSKFVITDSYHGLIFSIIYKKEFICIGKKSKAISRFESIFEELGGNLISRFFGDISEVSKIENLGKIDYQEVHMNLEKLKEKSLQFIEDNIGKNKISLKTKEVMEYNEMLRYFEMYKKNSDLQKKISDINIIVADKTQSEKDLNDMINILRKDNSKLNSEVIKQKRICTSQKEDLIKQKTMYISQKEDLIKQKTMYISQKEDLIKQEEVLKGLINDLNIIVADKIQSEKDLNDMINILRKDNSKLNSEIIKQKRICISQKKDLIKQEEVLKGLINDLNIIVADKNNKRKKLKEIICLLQKYNSNI